MSGLSGWWPNSTGIGAISEQNFSNLFSDTKPSTFAGGAVYIPSTETFDLDPDQSYVEYYMEFSHMTWFKPAIEDNSNLNFPSTVKITKDYYNNIDDEEKERICQSIGCFLNSIDNIEIQTSVYDRIFNKFKKLISSNTYLYQNEALVVNVTNDYVSGILSDYEIVFESKTFVVDGVRISSDDIRQAYYDAIDNANSYLDSIQMTNKWFNQSKYIPSSMFMLIAHTPNNNFINRINEVLNCPADLCSRSSGWSKNTNNVKWDSILPSSANGETYLLPPTATDSEYNFFHIGLSNGKFGKGENIDSNVVNGLSKIITDNYSTIQAFNDINKSIDFVCDKAININLISSKTSAIENKIKDMLVSYIPKYSKGQSSDDHWPSESRNWAFNGMTGQYEQGFAGTLFNANKNAGDIPKVDCLIIAPTFSVFPEVYQCLTQDGPAWDYIKDQLTEEQKRRLNYRKYIFSFQIEAISINKFFIQGRRISNNERTAVPVGGLPAKAIRYATILQHQIDGNDFYDPGSPFGMPYIWPDNRVNGLLPNIHVKVYNPMYPGIGFSHSTAMRLLFIPMDMGTILGALSALSTASIGALMPGLEMGAAMKMYMVTYTDFLPSYRTLSSEFLWNPHKNSTSIHKMDAGLTYNKKTNVPDDGKQLPSNKIITIIDANPKDWNNKEESSSEMNNMGTWVMWPNSWATKEGDQGFFTRGLVNIKFKARIAYLNKNTDELSSAKNADLSKYSAFLEFKFYLVDILEENLTISQYLDKIIVTTDVATAKRKDSSHIDNVLGKWEICLPTYNNAGENHSGPGREVVWKYYVDNGYDSQTSNFYDLQNKSNRIFSPVLDNTMRSYTTSLFIDTFRGNSGAPRLHENEKNKGFGQRYLSADGLFLFVNIRGYFVDNKMNSVQNPENIIILFDMEDSTISTTGKLQEKRIEYSQYVNQTFKKDKNIFPQLYSKVPKLLKKKIENNNYNYDVISPNNINSSKYINMDITGKDDSLSYFYIRAAAVGNFDINKQDILNNIAQYEGSTSYFVTPSGLCNLTFIAGNPDEYWILSFKIEEFEYENGDKVKTSKSIFLVNVEYLDFSGNKIPMCENSVIEILPNTDEDKEYNVELNIGPFVSDMTMLSGGYIIISLIPIIESKIDYGNVSGSARIKIKNNIKLDHKNTIGRIGIAGRDPYSLLGRTISWYRGLTPYADGTNIGTDAVFVTDAGSNVFWTFGDYRSTFRAAIISPVINFDMSKNYGWAVEASYWEFPGSVYFSLLKSGSAADEKQSLSGASDEFQGVNIVHIDNFTNEVKIKNISNKNQSSSLSAILKSDGKNVIGTEAAIAESSKIGYDDMETVTNSILVSVTDAKSDSKHPKTYFFIRENKNFTTNTNMGKPQLYDVSNISISFDPLGGAYKLVGIHNSGGLVFGNVTSKGTLIMPLIFIEGRLPKVSDQLSSAQLNEGGIGDRILIENYPFNVISKGYFDVRFGSKTINSISNYNIGVIGDIVNNKLTNGNISSMANISNIHTSTLGNENFSRDGVEISKGKPAIIVDGSGGIYIFYSYSSSFKANLVSASCSPFIGRVYCIYSNNGGKNWTPPVCVFNLSPFNPDKEILTKRYTDMISYLDSNNGFNSNSIYSEFDYLISRVKTISDSEIRNISIEDFDVVYKWKSDVFYLSFWFGGYICYCELGPIINYIRDMWMNIANVENILSDDMRHPSSNYYYSYIYDAKNTYGEYVYSRYFWDPGYRTIIHIVAGNISNLINNSKTDLPTINLTDSPATIILKSLGATGPGKRDLISNPSLFSHNGTTYNLFYNDYWKGTFPPNIYVRFGNRDFNVEQKRQRPVIKYMSHNVPNIIFYNGENYIAHIPIIEEGMLVSEKHPIILSSA